MSFFRPPHISFITYLTKPMAYITHLCTSPLHLTFSFNPGLTPPGTFDLTKLKSVDHQQTIYKHRFISDQYIPKPPLFQLTLYIGYSNIIFPSTTRTSYHLSCESLHFSTLKVRTETVIHQHWNSSKKIPDIQNPRIIPFTPNINSGKFRVSFYHWHNK